MSEGTWHRVGPLADVPPDDVIAAEIDGVAVAVVRMRGDRVAVVEAQCTHGKASLADGFVDGEEIECPKHNVRFNVVTGEAVATPARSALRVFPCRVADGCIEVHL